MIDNVTLITRRDGTMRKFILALTAAMVFGFTGSSEATLYDRGGGMIYDSVLNITWLQDANYAKTSGYSIGTGTGAMTWSQAVAWADQLVYGGYSDWRLPTTGTGVDGYKITSSEMGYLYYVDLGNKAYPETGLGYLENTSFIDPWTGKTVSFLNMQSDCYWSGTEYSNSPTSHAWSFFYNLGLQSPNGKGLDIFALAVRNGDVAAPVPVPGTIFMLVPGLAGLFGMRTWKMWRFRV
jgi:hypothetical protein